MTSATVGRVCGGSIVVVGLALTLLGLLSSAEGLLLISVTPWFLVGAFLVARWVRTL